ncbi:hypothetical protein BABINDRAFT_159501 [Babjeviella inositovora NRRL Y-12698]|uniref:GTPase-activating protein GYP5 n=1 Tax=Babjeviella inositovora NRRL Y-12698 TaxID=984486 RepID=A0A1E3QZG5_9ASCO|nr:uncharacterized protein BABINDRAFT_159501 [Babjeviella inositovora NRRL Y-12698]ODQ83028.1 hypothetical protein BABINDRAFT_159501 [Babjeviella inositovora NRRL Y-12698]
MSEHETQPVQQIADEVSTEPIQVLPEANPTHTDTLEVLQMASPEDASDAASNETGESGKSKKKKKKKGKKQNNKTGTDTPETTEEASAVEAVTLDQPESKDAEAVATDAIEEPAEVAAIDADTTVNEHTALDNHSDASSSITVDRHAARVLPLLPTVDESDKNLFGNVVEFDRNFNNNLLVSRLHNLNEGFNSKNPKDQEQIKTACQALRTTFNEIKNSIAMMGDHMLGYKIDWELWTKVVNNYEEIVLNEPDTLQEAVSEGIPNEVRGMIWQLISNSKNFQLEEFYASIKNEPSEHEKAIKRDLSRTSFVTSGEASSKMDSLFHVIKAYSLFDPEVGYTQGMAFITVPLLMNMNDSEAFCLLVTLMKDYNLRSLFMPEMRGLHLLLYQFDRLLEDKSPFLYNHLIKQGIRSSMYASQWFLTFFAYKFPLDIVLRIYDAVITEGMESILKFAVNLMIKNESNLLPLSFDKLLEYLKDKLFNFYLYGEAASTSQLNLTTMNKRFSFMAGKKSGINNNSESYRLNAFVKDAATIDILPFYLKKYQSEFDEFLQLEKSKESEIKKIKYANGKLRSEVKILESNYVMLDRENIAVVNAMVHTKVQRANNSDENHDLELEIKKLQEKLVSLESKLPASSRPGETLDEIQLEGSPYTELPTNIEEEIQAAMEINTKVMDTNRALEEELMMLEDEYRQVDDEFKLLLSQDKKGWFTKKPFWAA